MAVLSRDEILNLVDKGIIKIEPFNRENIGPGSIDLTLDEEYRAGKKSVSISVTESTDYKDYTTVKKGPITLRPGEFVIGITKEKITLPDNICGLLSGRSRFARLGILVHATASFIQPGISNHQVLEIKNISKNKITLRPGLKICQLALMELKGKAKYTGKFARQ